MAFEAESKPKAIRDPTIFFTRSSIISILVGCFAFVIERMAGETAIKERVVF